MNLTQSKEFIQRIFHGLLDEGTAPPPPPYTPYNKSRPPCMPNIQFGPMNVMSLISQAVKLVQTSKHPPNLGSDFKNNQSTKQLSNLIWDNRKVETKLYLLPIGPNKIV